MNTMTLEPPKSRRLLCACLGLSLALHAAALSYFYYHPMVLQGAFQSLFSLNSAEPILLENEEENPLLSKNHWIDEVFQKIVVLSPHFQPPYDLIQLPQGILLAPSQEQDTLSPIEDKSHLHFLKPKIAYATLSEGIDSEIEVWEIPPLFSPPESAAPIASQLQIVSEMSLAQIPQVALPETEEEGRVGSDIVLSGSDPSEHSLNLSSAGLSKTHEEIKIKMDPQTTALVADQGIKHTMQPLEAPPLILSSNDPERKGVQLTPSYAALEEHDFSDFIMPGQWNDDFDVDVTFLPNPEGKGYIFSLALSSNFDLSSHSLKQNFYFIIDRSSGVQKHRFGVFKRAALKALSSMQQGDTFNILVVDKKITRFSPQNLPVNLKNIQAAETFLGRQEAGGFFGSSDIYSKIDAILKVIPEDEEQHTGILLTGGKTSIDTEHKQALFKKWVAQNKGKMSLYACAVGADNDLLLLDILCSLSGGKLIYSDTHASFPRKLAKLVLDLRDPIAKELSISAIPENPRSKVTFYPASSHLSTLFGHQPYVIIGKIDEPCAFDLVLQGRHRGEWIAIKKTVSFIEGHKGDATFEKRWNAEHVNLCYAKFLKEGASKHLKEAKEILKKSRCELALE